MSVATSFNKGDLIRVYGTVAGTVNVDPGTVYFQIETPGGAKSTFTYGVGGTVIKSATGIYYADVSLGTAGTWYYRFYSTGTGQAAGSDQTIVAKASRFD